jgi:hypothetical protein
LFSESNAIQANYLPHTAQQSQITLPPLSEAKASWSQCCHTAIRDVTLNILNCGAPEITTKFWDVYIFLKSRQKCGINQQDFLWGI